VKSKADKARMVEAEAEGTEKRKSAKIKKERIYKTDI